MPRGQDRERHISRPRQRTGRLYCFAGRGGRDAGGFGEQHPITKQHPPADRMPRIRSPGEKIQRVHRASARRRDTLVSTKNSHASLSVIYPSVRVAKEKQASSPPHPPLRHCGVTNVIANRALKTYLNSFHCLSEGGKRVFEGLMFGADAIVASLVLALKSSPVKCCAGKLRDLSGLPVREPDAAFEGQLLIDAAETGEGVRNRRSNAGSRR